MEPARAPSTPRRTPKGTSGSFIFPSVQELALLSDAKVEALYRTADLSIQHQSRYGILGMVCGTLSLLVAMLAFTFLIYTGHNTGAGVLLGTSVAGVIGKIIASRL